MKITVNAYAKINLMLDIAGKLDNGYHSLFMLMQSVSLCDRLHVQLTDGDIRILCETDGVPCDSRNTAYKAAKAFFDYTGIKERGAEIEIEKHIPHEAGLAGGSADAAAVIHALNKLCETNLSQSQLIRIGLCVGSDVPFCIVGGTCIVQDAGGVVSKLSDLNECHIVLCKPPCGVSTPQAYADYDKAEGIRHLDRTAMLHAAATGDSKTVFSLCDNVFEQIIDVPQRVVIKAAMREFGSLATCMSGSGPTVFGIFDDKEKAVLCADKLKKQFSDTYVCAPVSYGCSIEQ